MFLHQINLDYEKHCKHAFGSYVQAHDDPKPKNTNASRTLNCIYLRYKDNIQGGQKLPHLQTNEIICRQYITPVPITSSIIKQVHELAVMQKMPHGLKIKNRINNYLYDHTWIPGVEEDENIENGNGDDEQEVDFYDEMEPDEIEGLAHQNNASKEDVRHMEKESKADIYEEDNEVMQKETDYQTDDENESQIDFQSDKEHEDQSELDQVQQKSSKKVISLFKHLIFQEVYKNSENVENKQQ
jgi:hypothetical protein